MFRWFGVSSTTTNVIETRLGDGALTFWFTIQRTSRTSRELSEYLRSQFQVAVLDRGGPDITNRLYAGVTPDATILTFRLPGPATSQPVAVRLIWDDGTNRAVACEIPVGRYYDFTRGSRSVSAGQ